MVQVYLTPRGTQCTRESQQGNTRAWYRAVGNGQSEFVRSRQEFRGFLDDLVEQAQLEGLRRLEGLARQHGLDLTHTQEHPYT